MWDFCLVCWPSRNWPLGYLSNEQVLWGCSWHKPSTSLLLVEVCCWIASVLPPTVAVLVVPWTWPFKTEAPSVSLLAAPTCFHPVQQKNLELFLGWGGKRKKMSSAAEIPTEKGRHTTETSSEAVVSSVGKCHSLMGRQETPTQSAAAQCHFLQQLMLTPKAWMLWGFGHWLLGWGLEKQQWGHEEEVGGL